MCSFIIGSVIFDLNGAKFIGKIKENTRMNIGFIWSKTVNGLLQKVLKTCIDHFLQSLKSLQA